MAKNQRGRFYVAQPMATAEIADGAVTTAKLGADAVDGTKLADNAVDSEHYTDASIDTAHIADDQVTRAKIAENALEEFGINLTSVMAEDGAALGIAEEAGTFFRQIGTNQMYLQGEEALSETEASVGWFEVYLPPNYVDAGDVQLRAVVDVTGSGTLGTCTVDFEARESDNDGAVGSDLVTTAAQAVSATSAAYDFSLTATALVASDKLVCKLTTSIQETGGTAIRALITKLSLLCDAK